MPYSSFSELKASIADTLDRTDLTATIPDFITKAEAALNRELRHFKMIDRDDATLDTRFLQLPSDFQETVRLGITSGTTHRLELVSLDAMLRQRELGSNASGRPRQYAHIGTEIEVYPTPDSAYTVQLAYYAKIPPLSDSNTTNFVLQDAPDVYLYGALIHSAPYLKDDARLQVWGGLYASALASFQSSSDNTRNAGTGLRMRVAAY
jgi:hypothetical protein